MLKKHKKLMMMLLAAIAVTSFSITNYKVMAKHKPADTVVYNGSDGKGGYYLNGHHYSYVKHSNKVVDGNTLLLNDRWAEVYAEIDSNWAEINSVIDRSSSYYPFEVEKGWVDPDAYYKLPNNGLLVQSVRHLTIRAFISRTNVNYNYKTNYKTLHFDWAINGPAAVNVQGVGSGKTSWTTPANNNSCAIEYFKPGKYTITSTPYMQWNVNTKYSYSVAMYEGGKQIGTSTRYVTKFSHTSSAENTADKKTWTENITTSDLNEWLNVKNTTTSYDGDAEVKIIQ